jgi:tetratricopeptide (TPR) repeat protein
VCFEALCGRRARAGRTPVEIAHEIATAEPPDVREHTPGLPPAAAEALARGMARDPERRPRSAGELAAQLASGLERGAPVTHRRRGFADALALGLLALAVGAVVAVVLLSGGGDDSQRPDRPAQQQGKAPREQAKASPENAPAETTPAQTAPAEPAPAADPTSGAALNEQGFELMGRGDFAGAVPILRRAVASWPEDSTDLEYAYALYNLGTSLNRSGQSAEAIPYLEKRLNWSNQRGVVKKELKLARKNAGQG